MSQSFVSRRGALRAYPRQSTWLPSSHSSSSQTLLSSHSLPLYSNTWNGRSYADFSDIFKELAEKEKKKAEKRAKATPGADLDEESFEDEDDVKVMRSKGTYDAKLTEVYAKLRGQSRMGVTVDHDDFRKRFERAMIYKTKMEAEKYSKAEKDMVEGQKQAAEAWEQYKAEQRKKEETGSTEETTKDK